MNHFNRIKLVAILLSLSQISLYHSLAVGNELSVKMKDNLRKIAKGYASNRESFDFFTCNFTVTAGNAPDLSQAWKRGPLTVEEKMECLWIVDGQTVRYEADRSKDSKVVKNSDGSSMSVGLAPIYYLAKEQYGIRFDPIFLKSGGVHSPKVPLNPPELTPWDAMSYAVVTDGSGNPKDTISRNIENLKAIYQFDEHAEIEGMSLQMVRIDLGVYSESFYIDPNRGYLPIITRAFDKSGNLFLEAHITDVQECPKKRWYPKRLVMAWPKNNGGQCFVKDFRVTKLDVLSRPSANSFKIVVPAGVSLSNCLETTKTVNFLEDTEISADKLATLLEKVEHPPEAK